MWEVFQEGEENVLEKLHKQFVDTFGELGASLEVPEDLEHNLGQFVCSLYGQKKPKIPTRQGATFSRTDTKKKENM